MSSIVLLVQFLVFGLVVVAISLLGYFRMRGWF